MVEAHEREVLVECGATTFSLTPAAASDLRARLTREAAVAQMQEAGEDDNAGGGSAGQHPGPA